MFLFLNSASANRLIERRIFLKAYRLNTSTLISKVITQRSYSNKVFMIVTRTKRNDYYGQNLEISTLTLLL